MQYRSQSPPAILCKRIRGALGKKLKRMHGIHCIPLVSDPVHPLQGVENIARKNYVPSSSKNSCPGIKTLNHIESEPVKACYEYTCSHACM